MSMGMHDKIALELFSEFSMSLIKKQCVKNLYSIYIYYYYELLFSRRIYYIVLFWVLGCVDGVVGAANNFLSSEKLSE